MTESFFKSLVLRCLAFLVRAEMTRLNMPGYTKTSLGQRGESLLSLLKDEGVGD